MPDPTQTNSPFDSPVFELLMLFAVPIVVVVGAVVVDGLLF